MILKRQKWLNYLYRRRHYQLNFTENCRREEESSHCELAPLPWFPKRWRRQRTSSGCYLLVASVSVSLLSLERARIVSEMLQSCENIIRIQTLAFVVIYHAWIGDIKHKGYPLSLYKWTCWPRFDASLMNLPTYREGRIPLFLGG